MRGLFIIRRVAGGSMLPELQPGAIVFGWRRTHLLHTGDMVILSHEGIEKIKRVGLIDGEMLYVLGDNPSESTDSRQFGWIHSRNVIARVIWPRPVFVS